MFDVSLDYLVGDVLKPSFDKRMTQRLQDFELLTEEEKTTYLPCLMLFLEMLKPKKRMHKKYRSIA